VVLSRGAVATLADLPGGTGATEIRRLDEVGDDLPRYLEDIEKRAIREALDAADGNQSQAARAIGLTERNLRYKLRKWGW
jgi:two-component system NtrC family response regulator